MPIINKVSSELVFDLLNQANPNSPVKFSGNNLNLGKLTAITPPAGQIQNTKIMLSNKPSSEYIGRVEATYRRLDLSKLFRGLTITLAKFSPLVKSGSSTAWASFVKDLLPTFNAQMGTAFTADDLVDVGISRGSLNAQNRYQNTVSISAKATSLAYIGSFSFTWVDAPQDIDAVVTVTDLAGRTFPGGNVFDDKHPLVLNGAYYGVDWTDVIMGVNPSPDANFGSNNNYWLSHNVGGTLGPSIIAIIAEANKLLDIGLFFTSSLYNDRSSMANLNSTLWAARVRQLPSADFPEANSEYFNRVIALIPPAASSITDPAAKQYAGTLLLHYNV